MIQRAILPFELQLAALAAKRIGVGLDNHCSAELFTVSGLPNGYTIRSPRADEMKGPISAIEVNVELMPSGRETFQSAFFVLFIQGADIRGIDLTFLCGSAVLDGSEADVTVGTVHGIELLE